MALAKIFIKPILSRVKIIFDDTVESYTNHDDEVTVTFANNRDTQKYDLLVAADGLSSRVRGMMFGGDPRDHIHHEGVHIAYFTMKEDLLDEDRLAKWYNATKGRVIFLRPDPNPTGRTSALLMNVTTQSDFEAKVNSKMLCGKGMRATKSCLKRLTKMQGGKHTRCCKACARAMISTALSLDRHVKSLGNGALTNLRRGLTIHVNCVRFELQNFAMAAWFCLETLAMQRLALERALTLRGAMS